MPEAKTVPVLVSYTGIIGFVPIPRTSSYTVVVQNARTAGHHSHLPYIVLPDNAEVPRGTLQTAVFKHDDGSNVPDGFKAYLLEGWEISFDNHITSSALFVRPGFHGHVLRLAEGCQPASQGQDKIDGSYLRTLDKDSIAARLELTRGILDARVHEIDVHEWRFADLRSQWRALAQVVSHFFEIGSTAGPGNPALYVRFAGDSTFTVKVPPRKGYILLRIANTLEDLYYDKPNEVDEHVRLYYDLAGVTYPAAHRHNLISRKADKLLVPPQESFRLDEPTFAAVLEADDWRRKVGGANCPPGGWTG